MLRSQSEQWSMEDLFGVLSWCCAVLLSDAIALQDAPVRQRKQIGSISRFDSKSRPSVFHPLGGWQPSLECFDDAPIRAASPANTFCLNSTKQKSQLTEEARSISGEWLQSVRGGIVREGKFEAATRQVGKSVPAAVDPHRSIP